MNNADNKVILSRLNKDKRLLSFVINKLFTFGELSYELKDVDSSMGNIFCPFHPSENLGENNNSPAAKVYYNEEKKMYLIKCYATKRRYYAYNYIKLVLDENPYDYLIENKDISQILELVDLVDKGLLKLDDEFFEDYKIYINEKFEMVDGDTIKFVSAIYMK